MVAASGVGIYPFAIFFIRDLVPAIHADESWCRRCCAWFRRDRDPRCDVGEDAAHIRRVYDIFKESCISVAGGRGAEIGDDGLEGMSESIEESGDVIVPGFAISGVVRADLDGV